MPYFYKATKDKSVLVESKGFWSNKPVYFNQSNDTAVILDEYLTGAGLVKVVQGYINKNFKGELTTLISHFLKVYKSDVNKWKRQLTRIYRISSSKSSAFSPFRKGNSSVFENYFDWAMSHKNKGDKIEAFVSVLEQAIIEYPQSQRWTVYGSGTPRLLLHSYLVSLLSSNTFLNSNIEEMGIV